MNISFCMVLLLYRNNVSIRQIIEAINFRTNFSPPRKQFFSPQVFLKSEPLRCNCSEALTEKRALRQQRAPQKSYCIPAKCLKGLTQRGTESVFGRMLRRKDWANCPQGFRRADSLECEARRILTDGERVRVLHPFFQIEENTNASTIL